MGTVARDNGSGERQPAPQGAHSAICVDVIDKGMQTTKFGIKEQVRVVWEIDEENPQYGEPFRVSKTYSLSLHEKSTLCKNLEAWRGRRFTDEERKGFDVEKLIGAPCMVNVQHNESGGTVYANVVTITPLPKGMQKLAPSDGFTREMHREGGYDVRSPGSKLETAEEAEAAYEPAVPMPEGATLRGGSRGFALEMQESDLPF